MLSALTPRFPAVGSRIPMLCPTVSSSCVYTPTTDANLPPCLPHRDNLAQWHNDTPLTNTGCFQSQLIGESFRASKVRFTHVFVSCGLRSIQTAYHLLKGAHADGCMPKFCHEPFLLEYLMWYREEGGLPKYLAKEEIEKSKLLPGLEFDKCYVPGGTVSDLTGRIEAEVMDGWHERARLVARAMMRHIDDDFAEVLVVGHAGTLCTMSRALMAQPALSEHATYSFNHIVPYLGSMCLRSFGTNLVSTEEMNSKPTLLKIPPVYTPKLKFQQVAPLCKTIRLAFDSRGGYTWEKFRDLEVVPLPEGEVAVCSCGGYKQHHKP